jgi:BNR repeat protein
MRRSVPAVAALALALALVGPVSAGAGSVSPLSLASGPSPYAGCTVGQFNNATNYVNAEVEPFVAVNPTRAANLVGVFQQDRWSNGGAHGLSTVVSFDGGATWIEPAAPHFSTCAGGTTANGGAYDRSSDPWVSFGPDGIAYQVSLSVSADQTTSAVLASTSTDGGLIWSEPATIIVDPQTPHFNDKESVTADPNEPGTAYIVWDRSRFPSDNASFTALNHSFAFRGSPFFSMTTDGGLRWSPARQIGPNQNIGAIGNQIAVEPDGTLLDFFHFGKGSGFDAPNSSFIGGIRSTDRGARWSAPFVVSNNPVVRVVDPETGVPLRTGSDVGGSLEDVAVDPSTGQIYVVWEDSRFSGTHNDIAMSTSTDAGKTWTDPVKVNQTPGGATAFTPAVDVLPDGTVAVGYYDWRNNTPAAGLPVDYFVAHSHDHGATWSESRLTPASFDVENAPNSRGYFLGDYQGMAHDGTAFKSFFVQTNSGSLANRTDVFSATVTP